VFVAFFLRELPSMQIILFTYINSISFVYIGVNRPLILRYKNRLELFNEFIVVLISQVLFTFTDFVESEEWKYTMGFYMIGLICLSILVNFLVFLKAALNNLKLMFVKVYRLLKHLLCKKKSKTVLPLEKEETYETQEKDVKGP
jgi:hypothetical protein